MNKYEIIDMIDEGAYGIVWKATNKDTGNLVAIKEFKEGDDDQISRKSIQREIRMLKMLKSEYIVNIKQAFKKKNKVFLIFEYFPKNLLNMIQLYQHGLDPSLINKIAFNLLKCLRFLHQKNIIHRDIKPENILLSNDASVLKLCDFGFARFMPENGEELTEYVATRWYRSPELLVGAGYGKPADLWALGCIIGELVDGQPMFPGQNQMDQLYLIRKTLGQLPQKQIKVLQTNQKFQGLAFPPLKRIQSIQARYIGKIQKKALSFMKACLNLDPNTRITVQQALSHPYVIQFSMKQNQLINEQTNLLYSSRKLTQRNSQIFEQQASPSLILPNGQSSSLSNSNNNGNPSVVYQEKQKTERYYDNVSVQKQKHKQTFKPTKNKFFNNNEKTLKIAGGSSLPQNSLYKVVHQAVNQHNTNIYKMSKKFSEVNLKHDPYTNANANQFGQETRTKMPDASPKLKIKKQHIGSKLSKVMSQQKKINYNIDVKLNINLKINQKLKNTALNANTLTHPNSNIGTPLDGKLPQIKNYPNGNGNGLGLAHGQGHGMGNGNKILKYRLQNKYPGANINTIYNNYGNLSILGESKQVAGKNGQKGKSLKKGKE